MAESLSEIAALLSKKKRVVITSHISPDSDAVASSCGLALALRTLGVETQVYLFDSVPVKSGAFLRSIRPVHSIAEIGTPVDAVVSIDSATRARIGADVDAYFALAAESFNLDHHISNERFATHNFVGAEYASASEIVLDVARILSMEIDEELATLLLSGLMEDTGSFRFSNTTETALKNAAALVALGAKPDTVSEQLYFNVPERVLRLRQKALETLEIKFDGKVSVVRMSADTLAACGATPEDTDGLVDEARSVSGTVGAVLMRELADGWKMSVRAKDSRFSAQEICAVFGGGGHRAAAGCTIRAPLEDVEKRFFAAVQAHLRASGLM